MGGKLRCCTSNDVKATVFSASADAVFPRACAVEVKLRGSSRRCYDRCSADLPRTFGFMSKFANGSTVYIFCGRWYGFHGWICVETRLQSGSGKNLKDVQPT